MNTTSDEPGTDRELIARALSDDESAFAGLVGRYRHQVYGLCWNWLRNREDAEDAAQETFLTTFQKLHTLRDSDKFAAWLRKIAANCCKMRQRSRGRELTRAEPLDHDWEVDRTEKSSSAEIAGVVSDALTALPSSLRLPFVLRHIDGLNYAEIADFLDASESTIRGRIYTAKNRLREELADMAGSVIKKQRLSRGFTKRVTKSLFWHEEPVKVQSRLAADDVCFIFLHIHSDAKIAIEGTRGGHLTIEGRKVLFGGDPEAAQSRVEQIKVKVSKSRNPFGEGPTSAKLFDGMQWGEGGPKAVYGDSREKWRELKEELEKFPATLDALREGLKGEVVEVTVCTDQLAPIWLPRAQMSKTKGFVGVDGGDRSKVIGAAGGAELRIKLPPCRRVVIVSARQEIQVSKMHSDLLLIGDHFVPFTASGVEGDLHVFGAIPRAISNVKGDLRLHVPYHGGGSRSSKGNTERWGWKRRRVSIRGVRGSSWVRVRSMDVEMTCSNRSADVESCYGDLNVVIPRYLRGARWRFASLTGSACVSLPPSRLPKGWKMALWTEAGGIKHRGVPLQYGLACAQRVYAGTVPWQQRDETTLAVRTGLGAIRVKFAK